MSETGDMWVVRFAGGTMMMCSTEDRAREVTQMQQGTYERYVPYRTHATALATVQAERKIAEDQRDQVTKELEETKAELQAALREANCLERSLATARADVLQEVRAVIGGCGDNSCLFVRPKGMATNGGCRCLRQPGIGQKLAALLGGAA